ncbi:MAG: transglutaminase domain-containing protein [Ruminococcus sp.]|nr:transglutaminase domain-containing protein [Ruminococcus sp.]
MKRILSLLLISAMLTGCGHISEDKPYVAEGTTTVSKITETTASDAIDTTTSVATVTSEVTAEKSSQSVTEKTTESMTTAAADTNDQPKKDDTKSQTAQDNKATEVQKNESQTTTKAQTSPKSAETSPAVKENKTTTTVRTTTPVVTNAPPVTTQAQLTTEKATEPEKMNITEHWLIYFSDSHDKEYYVNIGRNLPNDGSDNGKAQAVFDYVTSNYSDDNACTYLSAVTMSLCEGIGLDCGYALISNWYDHCANAVKVDGNWYVLDAQAGGYLCGNFGFSQIMDEYENKLSISLSEDDY